MSLLSQTDTYPRKMLVFFFKETFSRAGGRAGWKDFSFLLCCKDIFSRPPTSFGKFYNFMYRRRIFSYFRYRYWFPLYRWGGGGGERYEVNALRLDGGKNHYNGYWKGWAFKSRLHSGIVESKKFLLCVFLILSRIRGKYFSVHGDYNELRILCVTQEILQIHQQK